MERMARQERRDEIHSYGVGIWGILMVKLLTDDDLNGLASKEGTGGLGT
jgi:hypothetical protein